MLYTQFYSPLLRSSTSLKPLPHPQCGIIISRRRVCSCQRVLQVTLQCHPQCGYTLCLSRSETHTDLKCMRPNYRVYHPSDPLHPSKLFQVSVTLLASLCTYQPTQVTPARATTRRATPTAGLFILELCPSCWPRWWASWQCTCS